MRRTVLWLALIALALPWQITAAKERVVVCAKYATNYDWSNGYQVEATVLTGQDLNQATSSFGYQSYATYVAIFWSQDEVSIIQLDSPYLSAIAQEGVDQRGRRWQISKTSLCI